MFVLVFIVLLLPCVFSVYTDDYYRAAVASMDDRGLLDEYLLLIDDAKAQGAEILVFPEISVLGLPENITVGEIPCNIDHYRAVRPNQFAISCQAAKNQIYVAYDIFELGGPCVEGSPACWYGGRYLYNTEIVFDRSGRILTRYRKAHQFAVLSDITASGDGKTTPFKTDFGVTFGQVICFDIFFQHPAIDYVEKLHLTDIVGTLDWYDYIPVTGPSLFQAWSRLLGVNLLAANNMKVKGGVDSSGAGIFSNGVPLNFTMEKKNQVLIADVPIRKSRPASKPSFPPTVSDLLGGQLPLENKSSIITSSPGSSSSISFDLQAMTCSLSYTFSEKQTPAEFFLFVAASYDFQGLFRVEWCGLINCGETLDYCELGTNLWNTQALTTFDSLKVVAQSKNPLDHGRMFPLLGSNMKVLFDPVDQFDVTKQGEDTFVIQSTEKLTQPVLLAGHFGVPEDLSN